MEKKSNVGVAILFMVIGILIAAIIGLSFWIYALKKEQPKEVSNTNVANNDVIQNDTVEEDETVPQEDDIVFTNEEIKTCLQNYLDIKAALYNGTEAVLKYLFNDVEVYSEYSGSYKKTNISYDKFEKTILSYMSEKEFEKMNPSDLVFKNIDGILYISEVGASGCNWRVDSIEKKNNNSYIGHTTWIFEDIEEPTDFEFIITEYNGKCVIDSCESVKNETVSQNTESVFTEEEIKACLQNYLDIYGAFHGSPEAMLVKLGFMKYGDYKSTVEDGYYRYYITDIKYSDFKNKLLEYISEDWFEKCLVRNTQPLFFKDVDGFVYFLDYGASGYGYEVFDIKSKDNSNYTAGICYFVDESFNTGEPTETINFSIENHNGKCVISSCDYDIGIGG